MPGGRGGIQIGLEAGFRLPGPEPLPSASRPRVADSVRSVCLLVVAWRYVGQWPLVVGANRDERTDRPARAVTVLRGEEPRILGGRDEQAGGTWMAVNEYGVVCALTNRPTVDGPDPGKQSRGRLPLIAATARTATEAAVALTAEVTTGAYNPAWLVVADRQSLHYLAVGPNESSRPQQLDAGLYVLENSPLEIQSVKADHVRATLSEAETVGIPLWEALPTVLADHAVPSPASGVHRFQDGRERIAATLAACVHSEGYGTRSASLVRVGEDTGELPEILVADGPPCTNAFVDARGLWSPIRAA
jgi:uncharacterized protein with NRDE domain